MTPRAGVRVIRLAFALPLLISLGCSEPIYDSEARVGPLDERGREQLSIGKLVKRRQIAPVRSVAESVWQTRPERDAEEQPDRVIRELNIPAGATVVDFGAGVGYYTWRLARQVGPRGKVIAVDIQPGMIERLKETLAAHDVSNVETVLALEDNPRLPEGEVDLAILVDVYNELQQPEVSMQHLRRALKPDGRLVIIDYKREDASIPIPAPYRMTVSEVREAVEPVGFEFVGTLDFVPIQHIVIFRPGNPG